jgi:hypothetical protein
MLWIIFGLGGYLVAGWKGAAVAVLVPAILVVVFRVGRNTGYTAGLLTAEQLIEMAEDEDVDLGELRESIRRVEAQRRAAREGRQ